MDPAVPNFESLSLRRDRIWGDEDRIVPVEQSKLWQKFLPKADIKIFKGAGHLVLHEKPEAAKAVESFMSADDRTW